MRSPLMKVTEYLGTRRKKPLKEKKSKTTKKKTTAVEEKPRSLSAHGVPRC